MHHKEGHYAIDADKSMDAGLNLNILADYVCLLASASCSQILRC